jgi:hypothetical protein
MDCQPSFDLEQKQYILELVQELQGYVKDLPILIRYSRPERTRIAERMMQIKRELQKFRKDYPDA